MKVEVEKQPGSVSKLQIELPADEVAKEWDAIANSFARFAKIPGYRPGKAPRAVIDKRFRKEIQDELTKKLVSKSYHEAVEQEQLRVASLTNIEDIQFGEDKSMRFSATVVTAPEFELPDYKQIPVQVADTQISEADVEAAIERLRDQSADFVDVPERALQMGDFAVLDFEGSIENKPISEIAPQASKNLHGGKKFWVLSSPNWTWEFNLSTQQWNERWSLATTGVQGRWRGTGGHPAFGKWLLGDMQSGTQSQEILKLAR